MSTSVISSPPTPVISPHPFPMTSLGFWRGYGVTCRPYLAFVSGVSGMLGLVMTSNLPAPSFWAATGAFLVSYGVGQALTDVFQMDTDAISSPYRPLVRGEISRKQVLIVSLFGLLLCSAILFLLNPWTLALSACGMIGLATYTPFKRTWWGGPFWNSWIVALLPAIGFLCGGGTPWAAVRHPLLIPAMLSTFFSYAIFVLLGYFKDIEADRKTGYQTFPVRFGRRPSVLLSGLFTLLAFGSSAWLLVRANPEIHRVDSFIGVSLWLAGLLMLAWAHVRMWPTQQDTEAFPSIEWVVRGYVAFHAGEFAILKPEHGIIVALILLCLFELTLRARPSKSQI